MVLELRATVNGRVTRYFEAGSGQPLVFIHAFPFSAEMWRPQLERTPGGWRYIAPDLRGFGAPPPEEDLTGGKLTMDEYARDISALMDALAIDRAVIGGLSMGGYITFALFRLAPERFSGMILADTRPQQDSPEGLKGRRGLLDLLRTKGVHAVADDLTSKLIGATSRRQRPAVEAEVRRLIESNTASGIEAAIHALIGRPDSTPDLERIRCPTLVVVGDEDIVTPLTDADAMHRDITTSQLVVLSRAGHVSNLEVADEFSSTLASFLRTF
jgi:3-oxoadipate enol-lactonase